MFNFNGLFVFLKIIFLSYFNRTFFFYLNLFKIYYFLKNISLISVYISYKDPPIKVNTS